MPKKKAEELEVTAPPEPKDRLARYREQKDASQFRYAGHRWTIMAERGGKMGTWFWIERGHGDHKQGQWVLSGMGAVIAPKPAKSQRPQKRAKKPAKPLKRAAQEKAPTRPPSRRSTAPPTRRTRGRKTTQ